VLGTGRKLRGIAWELRVPGLLNHAVALWQADDAGGRQPGIKDAESGSEPPSVLVKE